MSAVTIREALEICGLIDPLPGTAQYIVKQYLSTIDPEAKIVVVQGGTCGCTSCPMYPKVPILSAEPAQDDEEFGPVNLNDVEPDRLKPAQDDGKPECEYESFMLDDGSRVQRMARDMRWYRIKNNRIIDHGQYRADIVERAEVKRRIEEAHNGLA